MDRRRNDKVEAAVEACRRACLNTGTPLTNYWLTVDLLRENAAWREEEIDALRKRFVESLFEDLEPSSATNHAIESRS